MWCPVGAAVGGARVVVVALKLAAETARLRSSQVGPPQRQLDSFHSLSLATLI